MSKYYSMSKYLFIFAVFALFACNETSDTNDKEKVANLLNDVKTLLFTMDSQDPALKPMFETGISHEIDLLMTKIPDLNSHQIDDMTDLLKGVMEVVKPFKDRQDITPAEYASLSAKIVELDTKYPDFLSI